MQLCNIFSKLTATKKSDKFFQDIIGYDNIKRLFLMALDADEPVHILLSGPPACAKTMFLQSLLKQNNSYFVDGSFTTKVGVIDCVFDNRPKYLLIDEIDKMSAKDQAFLLNLMETGIISETKHRKTRTAQIKTFVFATSNTIQNVMAPLQSRFFIVNLEPYTYEQFYEITIGLLTSHQYNVDEEIAMAIVDAIWNSTENIRDCVRIGRLAKSMGDVDWLISNFLKQG